MEIPKFDKKLISPNKIILPILGKESGILEEYIQTTDKACQELFTCAICSCLAWDPLCCPRCDKPFCRACLIKYGKNKKCPFKCDSYTFREMTRNEKNYLNKIKLKCTNIGCSKYIPYCEYLNHLEKCQLRKYHCKNQSCKEEGYINDMINHSKYCPFRSVECPKCKHNIQILDMDIHDQETCPENIVKCELCDSTMKRGIYIKEHKSDKNENVKCLQLQVEKWEKTYSEDITNKNNEILDLKNKIKEMEKIQKNYEKENANLKKNLEDIKLFMKNGYSRFFGQENEKKDDKVINVINHSERDTINRNNINSISISHFYIRNHNNPRVINRHNYINSPKKHYKVSVANSQEKIREYKNEDIRGEVKHNYQIKKVQSEKYLPSG